MSEYVLRWLTAVFLLLSAPALFAADSYPTKPIRVIVAYAPGGGNDVTARILSAHLGQTLGVTLESEASRWSQLIKTAGIKPD